MSDEPKPLTEFQAWPKIPRYKPVMMHITEKIDGTNACVVVKEMEPIYINGEVCAHIVHLSAIAHKIETHDGRVVEVLAASRTRFIAPEDDNFGFAAWVRENAEELVKLGVGRHYGEWYGAGIERRYGLDHKRFALFNERTEGFTPACCSVVPTLYFGGYNVDTVHQVERELRAHGSFAVPGWIQPEGIVVRLVHNPAAMKITDAVQGEKHKVAA